MLKIIIISISALLISPIILADEPTWPLLPEQAESIAATDLMTGIFYFHYLNENYQAASNQLEHLRLTLSKEQQSQLDVLEVTLLLALGLEKQAEELFVHIDPNQQGAARAWLYLARRWQAQGNWQALEISAKQALLHNTLLTEDELQETLYLLVLTNVEQESLQSATAYYNRMGKIGYWADLARYNLLVAQIQSYSSIYTIQKVIDEARYYSRNNESSLAILDRTYLLGALYQLENNRNLDASELLKKIRQNGPYSAEALLLMGWALLEQSKYPETIQPWRVLQQEYSDWHPAVLESFVSVPHVMEMMDAPAQALHGYELVEQRLQGLLEQQQQLQEKEYLQAWLEQWLNQQQGEWGWRRQYTEVASDPLSQSLMELFAQTSFRHQLAEFYDLKRMQDDLVQQQRNVELWQQMLTKRQETLKEVDGAKRLQALKTQQKVLAEQVNSLEKRWQEQEFMLFSYTSKQQQEQLQRLENVVTDIKYLQKTNKPSRNLDDYKERWRRSRGMLLWNITYSQSAREWASTREFWQLHHALSDMKMHLTHSSLALEWADSSWQGLEERLIETKQRISILQKQIASVQYQQQQQLVSVMQQEFAVKEKRLKTYQAQARLAAARLYDDALQRQLVSSLEEQAQGGQHD